MVKFDGSVSTLVQLMFWGPVLVHPVTSLGKVIVYAKVEATDESTKATTVSITEEYGGTVEVEGGKKGI
jgi:hypothetical protein